MTRGWVLGLGASLLVGGLGCMPVCEEAGLRRAAAAFEAHAPDQRAAGLQTLSEACPTLPSALRWHLQADLTEMPANEVAAVRRDRVDDTIWYDLLLRTCPRAEEPLARGGSPEQHGAFMRERCELERHGLLAPGEELAYRDLGPYMLHEWLVSQRVDGSLARAVVRPLLAAEATPEERETLCMRGELSCDFLVEAWGLSPPRSSGDLRLQALPELFVTPSAISLRGTRVVPLDAGRPSPTAFVDHVSPALLQRLERHPDALPGPQRLNEQREDTRLVVVADEATPAALLVDIAYTANQRGFATLELVARREHGLVRLPLSVPYEWLDSPERVHRDGLGLVFLVSRDFVRIKGGMMSFEELEPCTPSTDGCYEHDELAELAERVTQYKGFFPHETLATFRVEDDVSLQTLVSIIDLVRGGEACELSAAMAGDVLPEACLFWRASLDYDPPAMRLDDIRARE